MDSLEGISFLSEGIPSMEDTAPTPDDIIKGIRKAMSDYGKGGYCPWVEIMSPQEYARRVKHFKEKEGEK